MNWLNNVITDLQKRFSKSDDMTQMENSGMHSLQSQKSEEKINQFQSRLQDLDRRLLELR